MFLFLVENKMGLLQSKRSQADMARMYSFLPSFIENGCERRGRKKITFAVLLLS